MNNLNPAQILPALRFAIGGGAWAFPGPTGKAFGLKLGANHEAVFLGRLFGIRDVALGAGLLASTGESRKLWWRLGVVCDLADAAAAVLTYRAGGPKQASVMAALTALGAAGLGLAAVASESG